MHLRPPASEPRVIGLVLTLRSPAFQHPDLLSRLQSLAGLRTAEPFDRWLAVTAETPDPEALHQELEALEEVAAVDVVFVELAGEPDPSFRSPEPPRRLDDDSLSPPGRPVPPVGPPY